MESKSQMQISWLRRQNSGFPIFQSLGQLAVNLTSPFVSRLRNTYRLHHLRILLKPFASTPTTLFSQPVVPNNPGKITSTANGRNSWQQLFNQNGFACKDDIRPKIWNAREIEVWYRQNIFSAYRSPDAGQESRIPGMVHAEFLPIFISAAAGAAANNAATTASERTRQEIISGSLSFMDYPKMTVRALLNRIKHRLNK